MRNEIIDKELVEQRGVIAADYRILCHALILQKIEGSFDAEKALCLDDLKQTKETAQTLLKIYEWLDEPSDCLRMEQDIAILSQLTNDSEYKKPNSRPTPSALPQNIRLFAVYNNLTRLANVRLWRFILTSTATFSTLREYLQPIISRFFGYFSVFFAYLAWVYFTPRLLLNTGTLIKKAILNHPLDIRTRIIAYLVLHRRGFELWNDMTWFSGGFALCFILTGANAIYRPYVSIFMQTSDALQVIARSTLELYRLSLIDKNNKTCKNYAEAYDARKDYEQKVSLLIVTNHLLMILSLLPLIPSIGALHPLLPLAGAILALMVTLRFYIESNKIEKSQPNTNLKDLLNTSCPSLYQARGTPTGLNVYAFAMTIIWVPLMTFFYTQLPIVFYFIVTTGFLHLALPIIFPKNQKNEHKYDTLDTARRFTIFSSESLPPPVSRDSIHANNTP